MKFIAYVPGGYPSIKKSLDIAKSYIEAGCGTLEISFPPSDPVGEAEKIAYMMNEAYKACHDYFQYMDAVIELKTCYPKIEIYLLLFSEIIDVIGQEQLSKFCRSIDVSTIICPDLIDASKKYPILLENNIAFATPLHFEMKQEEINNCIVSKGFIYAQAYPLIGQSIHSELNDIKKIIAHLKKVGVKQPIYAGVGIKSLDHVKEVKEAKADGFFMGSYLLQHLENKDDLIYHTKQVIATGKDNE